MPIHFPPNRRVFDYHAQCHLGECRALDVDSENWPQPEEFLPYLQAHDPNMGQKDIDFKKQSTRKFTVAVDLNPTTHTSDRLIGWDLRRASWI